jgi:hypothetical protein
MEDKATNTFRQSHEVLAEVVRPALAFLDARMDEIMTSASMESAAMASSAMASSASSTTFLTGAGGEDGGSGGVIAVEMAASQRYHVARVHHAIRDEVASELWDKVMELYERLRRETELLRGQRDSAVREVRAVKAAAEAGRVRAERREASLTSELEELGKELSKSKLKRKNLKVALKERDEAGSAFATERTKLQLRILELEGALNNARLRLRSYNAGEDEDDVPVDGDMGMGAVTVVQPSADAQAEERVTALETMQKMLVVANAKLQRLQDAITLKDMQLSDYEARAKKADELGGLGRFFKEGGFEMVELLRAVVGLKNKWELRSVDFIKSDPDMTQLFAGTLDLVIVDTEAQAAEDEAKRQAAKGGKGGKSGGGGMGGAKGSSASLSSKKQGRAGTVAALDKATTGASSTALTVTSADGTVVAAANAEGVVLGADGNPLPGVLNVNDAEDFLMLSNSLRHATALRSFGVFCESAVQTMSLYSSHKDRAVQTGEEPAGAAGAKRRPAAAAGKGKGKADGGAGGGGDGGAAEGQAAEDADEDKEPQERTLMYSALTRFKRSGKSSNITLLRPCLALITTLYTERIESDLELRASGPAAKPETMAEFVMRYFYQKYGTRTEAESHLGKFVSGVVQYAKSNPKVQMFARFCVLDEPVLSQEDLGVFLALVEALHRCEDVGVSFPDAEDGTQYISYARGVAALRTCCLARCLSGPAMRRLLAAIEARGQAVTLAQDDSTRKVKEVRYPPEESARHVLANKVHVAVDGSEDKLKAAFKGVDRDGSGVINLDQFGQAISNLGVQITDKDTMRLAELFDRAGLEAGGPGSIVLHEAVKLLAQPPSIVKVPLLAYLNAGMEAWRGELVAKDEQIAAVFADANESGSNHISVPVFAGLVRQINPNLTDPELFLLYQKCLKEGSDLMPQENFVRVMREFGVAAKGCIFTGPLDDIDEYC